MPISCRGGNGISKLRPLHPIIAALALSSAPALAQAEPAPEFPKLEFAFEERVELGGSVPVGKTALGERNIVTIAGGTFEGPGIKGTIRPGGWDWQLRRADGCTQIKADYMLRTDDGAVINVINQGVGCPSTDGSPRMSGRTSATFEAPLGKYQWLGQSPFVGTLDVAQREGKTVLVIRFYKVV